MTEPELQSEYEIKTTAPDTDTPIALAREGRIAVVKPLEWRQDSPQVCRAKTILGTAATMKCADGYFVWRLGDLAFGSEKTKDAAEKMLWGTYKARILSALSLDVLALAEERDRLREALADLVTVADAMGDATNCNMADTAIDRARALAGDAP